MIHYRSCTLCEATCGVAITTEGDRVTDVRGDAEDPFSKGYICPKASALVDLHTDPDRLRSPVRREGERWIPIGWDEAFDLVARRLREIRARAGADAVAVYQGNPTAHNLGLLTYGQLFLRAVGTRNRFSATSLDQLPHMLAAELMFGNGILMPVPDIERCDLFVCIGANPLASNGSIMTAPDMRGRLRAIQERGGRVIVLDPRRTETAEKADEHRFIRPGTDAVLLLAIIHELFATGLAKTLRPARVPLSGVAELRAAAAEWTPERAAPITGMLAQDIRDLARALGTTRRAVLYGRIGVCTQEFGGLAAWLVYAVNALSGHLDEEGGLMFTTPAVDPVRLADLLASVERGLRRLARDPVRDGLESYGGFRRWRSRVSGKPEFGGELPMSAFAEEMETPGRGQIRALVTVAGNPVLSAPGGPRIERALGELEFMVSLDMYVNETTRHAHVILPPTSPLERAHYDLALNAFAVRNVAKYSPALFPRAPTERHDWEICAELWARLGLPGIARGAALAVAAKVGVEGLLEGALRMGPHGLARGRAGLSLAKLRAAPHGLDLGPLEQRLPMRLATSDQRVHLAPREYLADLPRLAAKYATPDAASGLVLIGRRHLRSNNSWLHNSARLVKGPPRCTVLVHPADAAARGLAEGAVARVSTASGAIELPVEISDEVMPGVVSVPHGWGHSRRGARLQVAATVPGVSVNDILDPAVIDELSGTSVLTGQRVEVVAV